MYWYISNGYSYDHVALYLGKGMLMHALNRKYGTIIQSVQYYESWDSKKSSDNGEKILLTLEYAREKADSIISCVPKYAGETVSGRFSV